MKMSENLHDIVNEEVLLNENGKEEDFTVE